MKTSNKFSEKKFILYSIIWTLISFLLYKKTLFRCIDNYSLSLSMLIFGCTVFSSSLFGIAFDIENSRNKFNVFLNTVFGFGLYTVFSYIQIKRTFIVIVLSVVTSLAISFNAYIIFRKKRNRTNFKKIIKKRLVRSLSLTRQLTSFGFAIILFCLYISLFFNFSIINTTVKPATPSNLSEQSLANNVETLKFLQDDLWKNLSAKEKLNVLQTVANVEQRYLGLPNELNVCTANLSDGVLAKYKDDTHQITINLDYLLNGSSWKLLNSVCHEAYHCYEYRLVDVYSSTKEENRNLKIFYHTDSYIEEFSNYISGSPEDFNDYYNQISEKDARDYADEAVMDYRKRIMEYANNETTY